MGPDSELNGMRALAQELDSLRRAGLTYVPRVDPAWLTAPSAAINRPAAAPAPRPAAPAEVVAGPRERPAARPQSAPSPAAPATRPGALFDEPGATAGPKKRAAASTAASAASASASQAGGDEITTIPPQPLDLGQRKELLTSLCGKVAACTRCEELARTRTKTVFGVGNPQAKILFIGEAPGADEDKSGEPFVGRAGQLLTKIIQACKLTREEVFICNVLRCRPPGNRTPSPTEAANCWEWLSSTLAVVDPEYIVCLGSVAAQTLMKTTQAIGKMRGRFLSHGRAKVLCTYHPSYLLRNPDAKKDVWEDMKFLMRDMGVEL